MHVDKGDDKIFITQSQHNTSTSLVTHDKAKSATTPLAKFASEHTCLKTMGTHNNYQLVITLASLG